MRVIQNRAVEIGFFILLFMSIPVFSLAAEEIDPLTLYDRGDFAAARSAFLIYAKNGDAAAQNNLGTMYAQGQGGEQSFEKAAGWFTRAANQGLSVAQFNLATLYEAGRGVEMDTKTAVVWYRLAAQQNDILAQCRLGQLHLESGDADLDAVEAYFWLSLCAENAEDEDRRRQASGELEALARRMSDADIHEAQLLARDRLQHLRETDKQ